MSRENRSIIDEEHIASVRREYNVYDSPADIFEPSIDGIDGRLTTTEINDLLAVPSNNGILFVKQNLNIQRRNVEEAAQRNKRNLRAEHILTLFAHLPLQDQTEVLDGTLTIGIIAQTNSTGKKSFAVSRDIRNN